MSLIKKIDGYYFRGHIPKNLQETIGKKTQDKKLYTNNKKTAQKLIKEVTIEFKHYLHRLNKMNITFNNNDIIKKAINEHLENRLKEEEQQLICSPATALENLIDDNYYNNYITALEDAISHKSYDIIEENEVFIFLEDELRTIIPNLRELTKDELDFSKEYLAKKLLRQAQIINDRLIKGEYNKQIIEPIQNITQQHEQALVNTIQPTNKQEEIKPIYTIKEKYEEYREVIGQLRKWSKDTKGKQENTQKALLYYFKDIDINNITTKEAIKFRDTYKELPTKWMTRKEFKNLTNFEDIIKENKKHKFNTTSKETVNKEITSIIGFYNYNIKEGYTTKNPFEGIKFKITKITVNDKQKKKFTEEEINKIFETHYYTKGFNTNIEKAIEKILAPILALYSGMRLNELASLYKDDIKKEVINNKSYYYFDINRKYDKVVKSNSSLRIIPIHNKIIELGLLKYIEQFKEGERIFPNLTKFNINDNQDQDEEGRYGRNIGNWFLDQKKKHYINFLIEPELKSFHSLRHNFTDKLVEQGIDFESTERLLGHYTDNRVTKRYTEYQHILEFTNIVNNIEYKAPSLNIVIKKIKNYFNSN